MAAYQSEEQTSLILQELETRYGLFKYQVDGYSAWRLLRFNAAIAIQNLPFVFNVSNFNWRWLRDRLGLALFEIGSLLFPKRADFFVKTHSSAWNDMQAGRFKDICFDDFLGEAGSYFKLETLNNPDFAQKRKRALLPVSMTTALIDLITVLLVFLHGPAEITRTARMISTDIAEEATRMQLGYKSIRNTLRRFYWSKRIYKWMFGRIQPRFVMVSDTGEFSVWAAARELGIPAIEFQHGIFSRHHSNALPPTAAPYKDTIVTPDRIFLYGDYWRRELEGAGFHDRELMVVGSPYMDYYRQRRAEFLAEKHQRGPLSILLTTQGLDRDRLIQFIHELLQLARGRLDLALNIKLHPNEKQREQYERILLANHQNVRVLLGHELPSTFDLLSRSDIHMSIASAVHYDSLGLGVPTVILPLAGHEIVQHLADDGHAFLPNSPADLLDHLSKAGDFSVRAEVSAHYFKPNALQNIGREVGLVP
jgi:hypothetical protein